MSEPCARGCTVPALIEGEPDRPVPATVGAFCGNCVAIAETGLTRALELAEHLPTLIGMQAAKRAQEGQVSRGSSVPVPFSVGAIDALNSTFATLVYWSERWSTVLGVPAPALPKRVWRDSHGQVIGLPFGATHEAIYTAIADQADWQGVVLPQIFASGRELAVDLWLDALAHVTKLARRYPTSDRPSLSTTMLCPVDGARVLITPPELLGDDRLITCTLCGRAYSEADHDRYSELLHEVIKRGKRAA